MKNVLNLDQVFIKRCIELAYESQNEGDLPFGALLVKRKEIIAEGKNTGLKDITGHAEINAIKKAIENNPGLDLSECTLYSNFEPCAMCSFVIRDIGIGKVVFSVESPYLGGFSKWNILSDQTIPSLFFSFPKSKAPEIKSGILREKAQKVFDDLKWKMHRKKE